MLPGRRPPGWGRNRVRARFWTLTTGDLFMRVRHLPGAVGLALLLLALPAAADPTGRYFTITPIAGFTVFDGDLRYPNGFPVDDNLYLGARLGWQYNDWLGAELAGGWTGTSESGGATRDVTF